ncbi:MAG: hypothetical protein CSA62_12450 [Planctomycetota bacterium]|nr:MAG: hypothetical protein CSA62_12450 [Planctomycetota bacterium]
MQAGKSSFIVTWLGNELRLFIRRPRFVIAIIVLPVLVLPLLLQLALAMQPGTRQHEFVRIGTHGDGPSLNRITKHMPSTLWTQAGHRTALIAAEVDATLTLSPETQRYDLSYVPERPRSVRALLAALDATDALGIPCEQALNNQNQDQVLVVVDRSRQIPRPQLALFGLFAALASIATIALSLIETHTRDRHLRLTETMQTLPISARQMELARAATLAVIGTFAVLGFSVSASILQQLFHASSVRVPWPQLIRSTWIVLLMAISVLSLLHAIVLRLRSSIAAEAPILLLVPLLIGAFALGAIKLEISPWVAALIPFLGSGRLLALGSEITLPILAMHLLPTALLVAFATRPLTKRQAGGFEEHRARNSDLIALFTVTWLLGFALCGLFREQALPWKVSAALGIGLLLPALLFLWRNRRTQNPIPVTERRNPLGILPSLGVSICAALLLTGLAPMLHSWTNAAIGSIPEANATFTGALLVLLIVAPALVEEFVFRGILLKRLQQHGPFAALMISASVFALHQYHVAKLPLSFLSGLVFGLVFLRTRSWIHATLSHMIFSALTLLGISAKLGSMSGLALVIAAAAALTLINQRERASRHSASLTT